MIGVLDQERQKMNPKDFSLDHRLVKFLKSLKFSRGAVFIGFFQRKIYSTLSLIVLMGFSLDNKINGLVCCHGERPVKLEVAVSGVTSGGVFFALPFAKNISSGSKGTELEKRLAIVINYV